MSIIRVDEISKFEGQEVTIQGWVYNRTDKGKLVFLLVRDGYGFVQCVAFKGDLDEKVFDQLMRLPQESAVIISGPVRADQRAPGIPGGYEIGVKKIEIVQTAEADIRCHSRITAWTSHSTTVTCGSVCRVNGRSCACARRSWRRRANGWTPTVSSLWTRRS